MKYLTRPAFLWYAGLAIYSLAAWAGSGYYHPDEHFQVLEFANYLLGYTPSADLPWEFQERIRPCLQPAMAAGLIGFFRWIGLFDPFWVAFLLRWITGVAHVSVFFALIKQIGKQDGHSDSTTLQWMQGVCFLWFMPFIHVRFSSEAWSGLCLLLAFWCLFSVERQRVGRFLLAGFLMGLSFEFRFQIAFAGLGVTAWLILRERTAWANIAAFLTGALPALAIGALADRWMYGEWVFAPWNYFKVNILEGRAAWYGVSPWWYYVPAIALKAIPPLSIFGLAWLGAGIVRARRHLFVWVFIPFLVGHSLIGHKELRFLFPMAFIALMLAVWGRVEMNGPVNMLLRRIVQWAWKLSLFVNGVMLAYVLSQPAEAMMPCYRYLYQHARAERRVYAIGKNPYEMVGLRVRYYEPPGLQMQVPAHIDSLPAHTLREGDWLLSPKALKPDQLQPWKAKLVFSAFPEWVLSVQWNNWQDRTQIWRVYEITHADQ